MMRSRLAGVVLACLAAISLNVNAALIDRGGGLIYDDDLDITWLADADYAQTSGYDTDGLMNWSEAIAWAAQLDFGGATEWRLPNEPTGEMIHLFYTELGGVSGQSILLSTDLDLDLFSNISAGSYWSGIERSSDSAWTLNFNGGALNDWAFKDGLLRAWAVHDGDIGAVPLPAAVWLFGSGLLGLIGIGIKRRQI